MARRNEFRQQCIRLNDKIQRTYGYDLPEGITKESLAERIYPARMIMSKRKAYCSVCGCEVPHDAKSKECPHCHVAYKSRPQEVEMASRLSDHDYLCEATVMEGLQVLRFWHIGYYFHVGEQTTYYVNEVERQFINADGKRCGFARPRPGMGHAYDAWNFFKPITIKDLRPRYYGYYGDNVTPRFDLPCAWTVIKQTIPLLRRNGLRKSMHGLWRPVSIIQGLLRGGQVEKLWKQKQWSMASYVANNYLVSEENMASVRICTRNHYRIKDAQMWLDHMRTLRDLGLDTHNAHYVCPKNLKKAHNEMIARLQRRRDKEERARRAKDYAERLAHMGREKKAYVKRLGMLLTLSLKGRNLSVKPLQSVDEFAEEGVAMKHCVFSNGYYKHKDTLILSAKDGKGNRLATIEYNTKRFSIEQCRAACNQVPKRDAEIRSLITSHQQDFAKLLRAA